MKYEWFSLWMECLHSQNVSLWIHPPSSQYNVYYKWIIKNLEYCQSVEKRVIKARFLKCINENKKRENKIKKFRKWCKIRIFPKKVTAVPRKSLPQFPEKNTAVLRKKYRSSQKKLPQFSEKVTAVLRKGYRSSPKKATAVPRKSSCSFRKSYRSLPKKQLQFPKNNCIWARDGQLPQFSEKWLHLSRSLSVTAVPWKMAAFKPKSVSYRSSPKSGCIKPKSVSYRSSPKSGCIKLESVSYRSSPKNDCIWARDGQLPQFPEKWLH